MEPTREYLQRTFSRLLDAEASRIIQQCQRANSAGQGGRTLFLIGEASVEGMTNSVSEGARIIFNATGDKAKDHFDILSNYSNGLAQRLRENFEQWVHNVGLKGNAAAKVIHNLDTRLNTLHEALLDDFEHGMIGGQRMKKDESSSVVSAIVNSPGAIQQSGIGTFSQNIQSYQNILQAFDTVVSSPEFRNLPQIQQEQISDIIQAFKDESSKQSPDKGRLRRWTEAAARLCKDVGLNVAANLIVEAGKAVL